VCVLCPLTGKPRTRLKPLYDFILINFFKVIDFNFLSSLFNERFKESISCNNSAICSWFKFFTLKFVEKPSFLQIRKAVLFPIPCTFVNAKRTDFWSDKFFKNTYSLQDCLRSYGSSLDKHPELVLKLKYNKLKG